MVVEFAEDLIDYLPSLVCLPASYIQVFQVVTPTIATDEHAL